MATEEEKKLALCNLVSRGFRMSEARKIVYGDNGSETSKVPQAPKATQPREPKKPTKEVDFSTMNEIELLQWADKLGVEVPDEYSEESLRKLLTEQK